MVFTISRTFTRLSDKTILWTLSIVSGMTAVLQNMMHLRFATLEFVYPKSNGFIAET